MAYALASKESMVLFLEESILGRHKCCAGGLTMKSAKLSGIGSDAVVKDAISGAVVTLAGDRCSPGYYNETIVCTVTVSSIMGRKAHKYAKWRDSWIPS